MVVAEPMTRFKRLMTSVFMVVRRKYGPSKYALKFAMPTHGLVQTPPTSYCLKASRMPGMDMYTNMKKKMNVGTTNM